MMGIAINDNPHYTQMRKYNARSVQYDLLYSKVSQKEIYPLIRDDKGDQQICCVSPIHGRSFVICQKENGKWIVSKGNGLSYSMHSFIDVSESENFIWGILPKENAIRDYLISDEVRNMGIKTNVMEAVIELDIQIIDKGICIRPCLLQYEVECPYRLCDFPFMPDSVRKSIISSWLKFDSKYSELYLIAAEVLIRNLQTLHDNNVMHNALHIQNYTWALELLDFEASRTEKTPYDNTEYEKNVQLLMNGEIMKTYEIINYIGWCLGETIDYKKIDTIFNDYGYNLNNYKVDRCD